MGILARFSDIMKANINALLDKAEDPSKMVDQMLRDYRENLAEVKQSTAAVIANEKAAQRAVDECQANVKKYGDAAVNAIKAGKDDDARTLLAQKQQFEAELASREQNLAAAKSDADKMRQMYNKLVADISELERRRDTIKSKIATAKARETVNKMTNSASKASAAMGAFDRMEQKANAMLDAAEASAELDAGEETDAAKLAAQYGAGASASVEDELAALKAQLAGGGSDA